MKLSLVKRFHQYYILMQLLQQLQVVACQQYKLQDRTFLQQLLLMLHAHDGAAPV
jgi:hypothetical protein